jgi:hypothetical protein
VNGAFRSFHCPRTWGTIKMPFLSFDPRIDELERFPPFPPQGFPWKPSAEGSLEFFCGSWNILSFGPSEDGPGTGHSRDGIPVMSKPVFHMPRRHKEPSKRFRAIGPRSVGGDLLQRGRSPKGAQASFGFGSRIIPLPMEADRSGEPGLSNRFTVGS